MHKTFIYGPEDYKEAGFHNQEEYDASRSIQIAFKNDVFDKYFEKIIRDGSKCLAENVILSLIKNKKAIDNPTDFIFSAIDNAIINFVASFFASLLASSAAYIMDNMTRMVLKMDNIEPKHREVLEAFDVKSIHGIIDDEFAEKTRIAAEEAFRPSIAEFIRKLPSNAAFKQ